MAARRRIEPEAAEAGLAPTTGNAMRSLPSAVRRAGNVVGLGVVALAIAVIAIQALTLEAALVSCGLGWAMLAIAVIDARRFMIPDALSLPAIPAGLLASGVLPDPSSNGLVVGDHLIGAGLGGAGLWLVREAYYRLRGREGLGLGDVKLAAAAGAWVGWQPLSDVVLLAAGAALVVVVATALARRADLEATERIAFGVFLAPSIWIVWMLEAYARGL